MRGVYGGIAVEGFVCLKCGHTYAYRLSSGLFNALSADDQGRLCSLKMQVTKNIEQASVRKFARICFADACIIKSDGYGRYIPVLKGDAYLPSTYGPNSGMLHWLHIVVSNDKALILGTYHGIPQVHFQSCLDEFCYRFSCSPFGPALFMLLARHILSSRRLTQRDNHIKSYKLKKNNADFA